MMPTGRLWTFQKIIGSVGTVEFCRETSVDFVSEGKQKKK